MSYNFCFKLPSTSIVDRYLFFESRFFMLRTLSMKIPVHYTCRGKLKTKIVAHKILPLQLEELQLSEVPTNTFQLFFSI